MESVIDITQREIKLTGTKTYDGNTDADASTITDGAQGTYSAPGSSSNTSTFSTGLVSGGIGYFLPVNVADEAFLQKLCNKWDRYSKQ